jgi:nicotinamide mononucleotide transporter
MQGIELAAALLGVINVALVVRRSIWNYPFALVMVALYGFVFYETKLYSDALLQIFFFVINIYGWWNWSRSERVDDGVAVEWMDWRARIAWLGGALAASAAWGWGMARFTDAAAPYVDATIAGLSVTAQILQSLRRVESWVLWIAVDVIAIPLFFSRGLYFTTALYGVFLVLAIAGLIEWLRRAPARA